MVKVDWTYVNNILFIDLAIELAKNWLHTESAIELAIEKTIE